MKKTRNLCTKKNCEKKEHDFLIHTHSLYFSEKSVRTHKNDKQTQQSQKNDI